MLCGGDVQVGEVVVGLAGGGDEADEGGGDG